MTVLTLLLATLSAAGGDILVPRVDQPPLIEDFLAMAPSPLWRDRLARVSGFVQNVPRDGAPATEETDVYLAYDDEQIYVIFVAFDSEPGKIRAVLGRRDTVQADDVVEVAFDTFHDQRRAYSFAANPLGIQIDSMWTEDQGYNDSFDMVWSSRGRLTDRGFVVWMAVPFRSLRFEPRRDQSWGVQFVRFLPRKNEDAYWPHRSARIDGRMNQAAVLRGLADVSPGRNISVAPFVTSRSFRALDLRDPGSPGFVSEGLEPDAGVDAKVVLQDRLVVDIALNPDFSQVESDEPQVTVNQRFEVFFPEKRPFFLENAAFFETPIELLFTRRIADPLWGARLTGKLGRTALGGLVASDESPGKVVPAFHPQAGSSAFFGVFRLSREILQQSSLGLMFVNRDHEDNRNRVLAADGRFKLGGNWVTRFQAALSATSENAALDRRGTAYEVEVLRAGRSFGYTARYSERGPDFVAQAGFVPRTDIRRVDQQVRYSFRPENNRLLAWTPRFDAYAIWDHRGETLESALGPALEIEMPGLTVASIGYLDTRESFRPLDFPGLKTTLSFSRREWRYSLRSAFSRRLAFRFSARSGRAVNVVPAEGLLPALGRSENVDVTVSLRGGRSWRAEGRYFWTRLRDLDDDELTPIFTDAVFRARFDYQWNPALSLRSIIQYESTSADATRSALERRRNLNADFLFTYLVHPGTALHVGYNTNRQNPRPDLEPLSSGLRRTEGGLTEDAWQIFAKVSYLFQF